MTADVDFDVCVVGAGPAGSTTAYRLAQLGRSVVVIERGTAPGSKNLSGGVLYGRVLQQILPEYLDEAPIERHITRNVVRFLNPSSDVAIDYGDRRLGEQVSAVTVLRARFDAWLADKAVAAGALLMTSVSVDRVATESEATSRRVVGVQAGDDALRCHVVVAADGVNSFLAEGVGLRATPRANQRAVGVKAVVDLPREVIDERFGLAGDEGAAYALVGDCTKGIGGGGFLYTNAESLSVGVVLRLDDLVATRRKPTDVFDEFLHHPAITPLLRGGELAEYGCHLVNEGGAAMVGDVATDGMVVVGDAAGLSVNSGLTVRGMDLAIGSGIAAAEAIHEALEGGDVSAASLAGYRRRLDSSFVGRDMHTYRRAPAFLERPRMYREYGELLADVLYGAFCLDTTPRQPLWRVATAAVRRSPVGLRTLASDAIAGLRAL